MIHWTRPELDLFEFNGSRRNNIVWTGRGAHNFAPLKDTNPACKADARYKAVGSDAKGLCPFGSPDGIHWRLLSDKPVITEGRVGSTRRTSRSGTPCGAATSTSPATSSTKYVPSGHVLRTTFYIGVPRR